MRTLILTVLISNHSDVLKIQIATVTDALKHLFMLQLHVESHLFILMIFFSFKISLASVWCMYFPKCVLSYIMNNVKPNIYLSSFRMVKKHQVLLLLLFLSSVNYSKIQMELQTCSVFAAVVLDTKFHSLLHRSGRCSFL